LEAALALALLLLAQESTCHTARRKAKREKKDEAVIAVFADRESYLGASSNDS
jgi:hypothetical protein